jgi:hypothetical protein
MADLLQEHFPNGMGITRRPGTQPRITGLHLSDQPRCRGGDFVSDGILRKAACGCMALFVALCVGGSALAATLQDMFGKWRWQDFTIEVSACQGDSACAKIVAGPKNVGMDVFASRLVAKDGEWVGQITHPETKEVYNTRFQQKDKDRWRLDGCTATKVCLSGEFVRAK